MGFSLSEARKALSTMTDGMDVQTALDSLLHPDATGGNEEGEREHQPALSQRRVPSPTGDELPTSHKHKVLPCYPERPQRMRPREGTPSSSFQQLLSLLLELAQVSQQLDHPRRL